MNKIQTVYYDYSMMPDDFKERNKGQIDNYKSLCYHNDTQKPEGSLVKKGEDILSFSFYPSQDSFAIQAPIDGYIHYDVDGLALIDGSHSKRVKICDIFEDFNELVSTVYNDEYLFTVDEFTNQEEFRWTKVAGKDSMGFSFRTHLISFLIIEKEPYLALGDINKPDHLFFLFEDKSLLEYDLRSVARKGDFLTLIPICGEDLQKFLDVKLYKFRVSYPDTQETIGFKRPLDAILFQLFAKHFVSILDNRGIDWKSFEKAKEIREDITCDCYVYLMHDAINGFFKIGFSNKPEYRERTLQSEKPTIELICAKQFPSRVIAEAIESALHKAFADKRLRGEWFSLSSTDVEQIKTTLR